MTPPTSPATEPPRNIENPFPRQTNDMFYLACLLGMMVGFLMVPFGVALSIYARSWNGVLIFGSVGVVLFVIGVVLMIADDDTIKTALAHRNKPPTRSEERRVGKECRSR